MVNHTVSFQAEPRVAEKKSDITETRNAGFIPAVIYSKGNAGATVKLNEHDFKMMLKHHSGENLMIDLQISGGEALHVLIKEIQHHPLTRRMLHVDFHEISLSRIIKVEVAIELEGVPVGVSQGGGTLDVQHREVEVECKASDLVEHISIDVSGLKIGDHISAGDLTLPEGYTLLTPETTSLAAVLKPRVAADAEGEEEDAVSEPEVITGATADDETED
jgi:large subunit ribosomal protein L25